MREVFSSQDVTEVGYYKSVLDAAGISCFIRNENANSIGLAGSAFAPVLCLLKEEDYSEAVRVLEEHRSTQASSASGWICPRCFEENPGNFELCWNCKTIRAAGI